MVVNSELQKFPGIHPWFVKNSNGFGFGKGVEFGRDIVNPMKKVYEKVAYLDEYFWAHPAKLRMDSTTFGALNKTIFCKLIVQNFWIRGGLSDERKALSLYTE